MLFIKTTTINEFECNLDFNKMSNCPYAPQAKTLSATSLADSISPEDCSCWLTGELPEWLNLQDLTLNLKLHKLICCVGCTLLKFLFLCIIKMLIKDDWQLGRLLLPVLSKLPAGRRRKEALIGMYGKCCQCALPIPGLLVPAYAIPWAVLAQASVCLTATWFGRLYSRLVREEAQEPAWVAFRNVCSVSGLVHRYIFPEQSQCKRSCLSFFLAQMGLLWSHFHVVFCCCSCVYAIDCIL